MDKNFCWSSGLQACLLCLGSIFQFSV